MLYGSYMLNNYGYMVILSWQRITIKLSKKNYFEREIMLL